MLQVIKLNVFFIVFYLTKLYEVLNKEHIYQYYKLIYLKSRLKFHSFTYLFNVLTALIIIRNVD